jgi:polyphosphate kinase
MSEVIHKIWLKISRKFEAAPAAEVLEAVNDSGLSSNGRFLNREISDIQFIERVVEEAENPKHPFLERVRFLSISVAVLDQFYTVRVARLKRMIAKRDLSVSPDGLTAQQQLKAITQRADLLQDKQTEIWFAQKAQLSQLGTCIFTVDQLSAEQADWLEGYFCTHILPLLTPFTLDEEHPFPFIPSGGLCMVFQLADSHFLVPIPDTLPRFVALPGTEGEYVTVDEMLQSFNRHIFAGEQSLAGGVFQILRDNDLAKKERNESLRAKIELGLRSRHKSNVIRLKVENLNEANLRFVCYHLGLVNDEDIEFLHLHGQSIASEEFIIHTLPGLSHIAELVDDNNHPENFFPAHKPRDLERARSFFGNCFEEISHRDLMVHWPFEPFDLVVSFLDQAADDPFVKTIKQTLYRTSDDSPIVNAMVRAAAKGKAVVAVIELEARDNEASNIELAKRLEEVGVQIVYGIVGLKIHCKVTTVTRLEGESMVTYSHFGTGNYHPGNAKIYTDLSFFTRDDQLGKDANLVFNYITSEHHVPPQMLLAAPHQIRQGLYQLIDEEIRHAMTGKPAEIWAKVNSLTDPELIEHLYEASQAGVKIQLVVRRHCALIPGMPGMSENIKVKSIVGRFLEHTRIYAFANGSTMDAQHAKIYLASADWMERNLDERVEVMVPLNDPVVRVQAIDQVFRANHADSRQSWWLGQDGEYVRDERVDGFCAQSFFQSVASLSGSHQNWSHSDE